MGKIALRPSIRPQDEKLRQAISLICQRSEADDSFGATKLNKLLFYSDFSAYLKFGKSITGQECFRLSLGPAPRKMKPVMDAMRLRGEVAIREMNYYGKKQNRAFALVEPTVAKFTANEIDLIDRMVQKCYGVSGVAISEASHKFSGWIYARERETIPYTSVLVGDRKPTPREILRGLSLEQEAITALADA